MAAEENNVEAKWCYSDGNKWMDYDKETSDQLETNLQKGIKQNTKKQKIPIQVKLNQGPIFGTDENKNKYRITYHLDGTVDPPVIIKLGQTKIKNGKELKNVTRFPNNFDMYSDKDYMNDINNYNCKYKWYYQQFPDEISDDDDKDNDDDKWIQFDAITSKQIEMVLNQEKFSIILNKGDFSTPSRKGLCTVKFNHHSIPSEPTLYKRYELKKERDTEMKFEKIEVKDDGDDSISNNDDEVLSMLMLTKHYMRPLSMRYWTQKRYEHIIIVSLSYGHQFCICYEQ